MMMQYTIYISQFPVIPVLCVPVRVLAWLFLKQIQDVKCIMGGINAL